jgi:hypothetical protein
MMFVESTASQGEDESFEDAARDLFRHIGDNVRLRSNYIVQRFFENARGGSGYATTADLRTWVMRIARSCYAGDVSAGEPVRAERQLAIVEALCANESPTATAAKLGLSRSQFYRDRQAVTRRIARRLQTFEPEGRKGTAQVEEPLRFFMRRAVAMVDQGFGHRAVAELERLVKDSAPKAVRGILLMHLSGALISLGDTARAIDLQRASKRLLAEDRASAREASILRDLALLTDGRLERALGRYGNSSKRLGAHLKLRINERFSDLESEELLLQLALEASLASYESHRRIEARQYLGTAVALARKLKTVPIEVQVKLELVAGYLSTDGDNGAYWRYRNAEELALAGGSAEGAVAATIALAGHFGHLEQDLRTHEYSMRAIEIARRIEGKDTFATAVLYAGRNLLKTRFWSVLDPLLFDIESFCQSGTPRWARLKEAQGLLLARKCKLIEAEDALKAAESCALALGDNEDQAVMLCHLADVSQLLGRSSNAVSYARCALAVAEGLDSRRLANVRRRARSVADGTQRGMAPRR